MLSFGSSTMRALGVLALMVALAGCNGGGRSADPTPTDDPAPPEEDNGVLYIAFDSDGPATLEVPLPHLDSCRTPEHWMEGTVTSEGATAELRDAADGRTGRVLAVSGVGHVEWSSQIVLGPACETFRYDPWSIDPDPQEETVEVHVAAGAPGAVSVLVRQVRDACGEATLYNATPYDKVLEPGWTVLEGRATPVGC